MMVIFRPTGPILSFTAAASAPTSVQAVSVGDAFNLAVKMHNTDTTNDAVVGWGSTDAIAKANAAAPATACNCVYLQHGETLVVEASPNSYFSGIATANTAVVKVQTGVAK